MACITFAFCFIMGTKKSYLQSLGSLQLLAIVMVVVGHFGFTDNAFMNSLGVSFCFVYSGFFTALHHRFDSSYGLKDHCRFMLNKLIKLYPLHLLAIALNIIVMWRNGMIHDVSLKVLFYHLTLLSSWIPIDDYYFGYNPVAWYICSLFFLYLMAPVVARLLRRISIASQVLIIMVLLILEYIGGYVPGIGQGHGLIGTYYLYQFPPMRLLDFALGIILFNVTLTPWWSDHTSRLSSRSSTLLEVAAIVAFAILFWLGKTHLNIHCYRALCASAPAIVVILATFILTSSHPGAISRALCVNPFPSLCKVSTEVYLLQFFAYFSLMPWFEHAHIDQNPLLTVPITVVALFLESYLIHRYFTQPLNRMLRGQRKAAN